ncbi:MAG: hypothetical protein HC851_23795 [Acaryochloris sp. RU_4_1]|nr:hypothetical protein [Acaryochloris sp. RU_4_1]NJR57140.1 hypothetical protein [Acaryochloris sp. CRU_2_0]
MSEFTETQFQALQSLGISRSELYTQYPNSHHNAIRTIAERGTDVLPKDTVIDEMQVYYGDVAYCAAIEYRGGRLVGFDPVAYAHPPDNDCVSYRINGVWAYIQVAQLTLLDLIGEITLPPMPTEQDVLALVTA